MERRIFLASLTAVTVLSTNVSLAEDNVPKDSVMVDVTGNLGTIYRQENDPAQIGASILAGGGEFILDCTANKDTTAALSKLADEYIKHGSTAIISPRLRIKGNLEYRPTQIVEADGKVVKGPDRWVLVVTNLTRL